MDGDAEECAHQQYTRVVEVIHQHIRHIFERCKTKRGHTAVDDAVKTFVERRMAKSDFHNDQTFEKFFGEGNDDKRLKHEPVHTCKNIKILADRFNDNGGQDDDHAEYENLDQKPYRFSVVSILPYDKRCE